jgi:hypothetical protein
VCTIRGNLKAQEDSECTKFDGGVKGVSAYNASQPWKLISIFLILCLVVQIRFYLFSKPEKRKSDLKRAGLNGHVTQIGAYSINRKYIKPSSTPLFRQCLPKMSKMCYIGWLFS